MRGAATRLSLPTPLPVGKVNCWLLEGDPVTLIDAGPFYDASFAALEAGLAGVGLRLEDVEQLILTHQHVDHVGNAAAVVERSGCRVVAYELLAGFVRDIHRFRDAENAYQDAILALHGTAAKRRAAFWAAIDDRRRLWNGPVEVDVTLGEGDTVVAGGRTLRASLRPGHSPTDTIYVDEEERVAYAADHLLPHISSNPLASRPLLGDDDPRARRSSLRAYLDSLALTAEEDLVEVRPGHGRVIDGHRHLIALRAEGHRERTEQVAVAMGPGASTAREIADGIWPGIAITQTFLTLCETLGALDLLEEAGRVRQVDDGDVIRWERT